MARSDHFSDDFIEDVNKNLAHKRKRRAVDTSLREFADFFDDEESLEDMFDTLDIDVFEPIRSKRAKTR